MHIVFCKLFERPRHMQWLGMRDEPSADSQAGTKTSQGAGRARRAWTTEPDIGACGKYHSAIPCACRVRSCFFSL